MRPLILESLITGLAGAAVAIVVTSLSFDALIRQVPRIAYGGAAVGVDFRVLLFTLALGVLSGLLFGAFPAWRASRLDVQTLIQQRHPRHGGHRVASAARYSPSKLGLRSFWYSAQLIVSHEFIRVLSVPLGFDAQNVATVRVSPSRLNGLQREAFFGSGNRNARWPSRCDIGRRSGHVPTERRNGR